MTAIEITPNLSDNDSKDEFRTKTYEMLSKEFQELYPKAARAYQLISLMNNRLTLIDNLSHKEARLRIINDHKHVPGFSDRNVRIYWPTNNPKVPRRIRPSWPKNGITGDQGNAKLNILEHKYAENTGLNRSTTEQNAAHRTPNSNDNFESGNDFTSNQKNHSSILQTDKHNQTTPPATTTATTATSNSHVCPECENLVIQNSQQIQMLEEALKKATSFSTANNMYNISQSEISDLSTSLADNHTLLTERDVLYFGFSVPYRELDSLMSNLNEQDDVWFMGRISKIDGTLLSCKIGKRATNKVKFADN